MDHQKEIAH
jgi:hypothetical protein